MRDAEHLLDGDRLVGLAVAHRVQRAVVPVLGRDARRDARAWCRARACGASPTSRRTRPAGSRRPCSAGRCRRRCPGSSRVILSKPSDHARRRSARRRPARPPRGSAPRPVADAFSMCWTGRPVRPSSFTARTPGIDRREDVADVDRVDVVEAEPGVVERGQPGVAAESALVGVGVHPEAVPSRRRESRPFPCSCSLPPPAGSGGCTTSLPFVFAQRLELADERHADAEVLLLAGQRHLHAAGPPAGRPARRRSLRCARSCIEPKSGMCTKV